jgi:hypothetical protein
MPAAQVRTEKLLRSRRGGGASRSSPHRCLGDASTCTLVRGRGPSLRHVVADGLNADQGATGVS